MHSYAFLSAIGHHSDCLLFFIRLRCASIRIGIIYFGAGREFIQMAADLIGTDKHGMIASVFRRRNNLRFPESELHRFHNSVIHQARYHIQVEQRNFIVVEKFCNYQKQKL